MTENLIIPGLLCYIIIVVLIYLEHRFFGDWPELLRRGLGATTILITTLIPALLDLIDIWTWLFIALALMMAGAMLAFLVFKEFYEESNSKLSKTIEALTNGRREQ